MRIQPIVYTTRMAEAVRWWSTALDVEPEHTSEVWTSFRIGGASLALHAVDELPAGTRVEMSLVSDVPLESVIDRMSEAGIVPVGGVVSQPFGRQVGYRDPDGSIVQINQHGS